MRLRRKPSRTLDDSESGQAAVEAALTLPLVIFVLLGSLQLFMMLQARILAQVAVFRAVRSGSLNHGDCTSMTHAAIATLLPTLPRSIVGGTLTSDGPASAAQLFGLRRGNRYQDGTPTHNGPIVEIYRMSPLATELGNAITEDNAFDQWDAAGGAPLSRRLDARMLYWYRLRIPFADWVISRMLLAYWGLQSFTSTNPLMPTETAQWDQEQTLAATGESWPGGPPTARMLNWANQGIYLVPIRVSAQMRMMVPARRRYFQNGAGLTQNCPVP